MESTSSADVIFLAVLLFNWLSYLWNEYLSCRQYATYVRTKTRPAEVSEMFDEESFGKSRLYKIERARFSFVHSFYSQLEYTAVLWFGLIPWFWNYAGRLIHAYGYSHEILQSLVFFLVVDVIQTLMDIPWKLYDTFVIEQRHGFNRQTLAFFVKDKVKSFVLSIAIGFPVVAVIIAIIQSGGAYFFVYLWAFLTVLIFFMMTIYPEFIAPLFDKYTPLSEGELREKIEALASKLHFPLKKLYVVEGSKRSAHSNAYLYGFGNNKRIVLYDTLIGDEPSAVPCGDEDVCSEPAEKKESGESKKVGMSNDEVVAVLGHELGHWALSHMLWNVCITEVNLFLMLMGFAYFYSQKAVYEAFGFADEQPTLVGLLIVFQFILAPYNEILTFLMNAWSRRKEFEADRFSAELGYAPLLSRSLIKLSKDNLAFPISDWLYSAWNFSHPPVIERIQALKKYR